MKIAPNTWSVEIYTSTPSDIVTARTDGQVASGTITFDGDGKLRSVSSSLVNPITIGWTNGAASSSVTFNFGSTDSEDSSTANNSSQSSMTQFAGNYSIKQVQGDGVPLGKLLDISVDEMALFMRILIMVSVLKSIKYL